MSAFDLPSRRDVVDVDSIGDPAFIVDTRGVIVSCNPDAAWLFGRPIRSVIGRRCYSVVRACLSNGEPACSPNCPLIQGLRFSPVLQRLSWSCAAAGIHPRDTRSTFSTSRSAIPSEAHPACCTS